MNIVAEKVSKWANLIRKRANMNATIRELHLLNDYQLKDLGIERGQIESVARGIIDFHRTVRDSSSIHLLSAEVRDIIPSAADKKQ